jgi:hypothetical protein
MVTRSAECHCEIMGRRRDGVDPKPEDLLVNIGFAQRGTVQRHYRDFKNGRSRGIGPRDLFFWVNTAKQRGNI